MCRLVVPSKCRRNSVAMKIDGLKTAEAFITNEMWLLGAVSTQLQRIDWPDIGMKAGGSDRGVVVAQHEFLENCVEKTYTDKLSCLAFE